MTKLVIQIPCFNEVESLPMTIADLPQSIFGVDDIEYVFIDDGSEDGTYEYLRSLDFGVVVRLPKNQGLAAAFQIGLDTALGLNADIIVNTDADHQYPGIYIQQLVRPIIEQEADLVIGKRDVDAIEEFSFAKKIYQKLGTKFFSKITKLDIHDAPSGFRAYSRKAAEELKVFSNYTYTLETLICAAHKKLKVTEIDIHVNKTTRPSRLISSNSQYIIQALKAAIQCKFIYSPVKMTLTLFLPFIAVSLSTFIWKSLAIELNPSQFLFALVGLLFSLGLIACIALLANMVSTNRKLLERINSRVPYRESREAKRNNRPQEKDSRVIQISKESKEI